MPEDRLTELAKMLKDRENNKPSSITTGTVISPPPSPKIRLNEVVVLNSDQLVFAESIANSLKRGNEVIVMPVSDNQLYYVLDKAVRY